MTPIVIASLLDYSKWFIVFFYLSIVAVLYQSQLHKAGYHGELL